MKREEVKSKNPECFRIQDFRARKTKMPLVYSVKFWLRQRDVAHFVRSDVMCSISCAEGILHAQSAHHFRRIHHVPLAEHIVEKRRLLLLPSFFWLPLLGNCVMLTSENIVVLCASVHSASKLLIFVTSRRKTTLSCFARSTTNFA